MAPRYLEIWNNVFMEFMQHEDGSRTPLPRKNVDTGMGLERLTMVMQASRSLYDTDLYQDIIQRAASLAGVTYGVDDEIDRALRVVADHSRGATFLIADGVLPGNEGRSYILRRILRRAIKSRPSTRARRSRSWRNYVVRRHRPVRFRHSDLRDRQSQIVRKVLTTRKSRSAARSRPLVKAASGRS